MSTLTEDLKRHIDIIDVIGRHVQLKRSGSNYTGLCPFHREKSPSFMVSQDKQIYKCFGCGLGGDSISFVMEYDKMDFWDAIKELATRYHFDLTPYKSEKSSIEGYIDTKDQREKIKLINKLTTRRFTEQLNKSSEASDYIHDRRKLGDEIITRRQIGYAPTNGQLLIHYLQSKGFTTEDMMQAGLIKQSSSHGDIYSFFRHRMMFPISDHVGNIVGFGGRTINPEDQPKYLNTTETPMYHKSHVLYGLHQAKESIRQHGYVIIVEGYMDVIALDRLGLGIGIAPCGTSLTSDHIKLLSRYTQDIVLMFDNDKAGQIAGIRSVKLLLEQGVYPRLLVLPQAYKDIDDLANAQLPSDEIHTILTHMVDWFDGIVTQLTQHYPIDHPVAVKQLINELFALLSHIGDFSVFMGYLNKLAKLVSIDENGLLNQYKQRHRSQQLNYRKQATQTTQGYTEDIDILLASCQERISNVCDLHTIYTIAQTLQQLKSDTSYSQEQLGQGQLRRSKTLDHMSNDQQCRQIEQFLMRYIQQHTQYIIKSSVLTLDEKQSLLNQIKTIQQQ